MTTPTNYSIPLLTAVGNHEAGGFVRQRSENVFYIRYMPHELVGARASAMDPQTRNTSHVHLFANHLVFVIFHITPFYSMIILDTYVHDTPTSQLPQLRSWLRQYGNRRNRMVSYHAPAFPSFISDEWLVHAVRETFVPVFDEYNVTAVFENHLHNFSMFVLLLLFLQKPHIPSRMAQELLMEEAPDTLEMAIGEFPMHEMVKQNI